jgi:predicted Zn-dependent protease
MQPLTPPDSHRLSAAQGWLELGSHLEANAELEEISPAVRSHPDVLELKWDIYAREQKWEACVKIALAIMRSDPGRPKGWISHSFALHELKRTQEAYTHLATVADKFPDVWTIPYNLACYCSQLGLLDEAQKWLKRALSLDGKRTQQAAIDDRDLKPLWDSMGTQL